MPDTNQIGQSDASARTEAQRDKQVDKIDFVSRVLQENPLLNSGYIQTLMQDKEIQKACTLLDKVDLNVTNKTINPNSEKLNNCLFEYITKNPKYAFQMAVGVIELAKAKLVTKENIAYLEKHPEYINKIVKNLIYLHKSKLYKPKIFHQIIEKNVQHADKITSVLYCLERIQCVSADKLRSICKRAEHGFIIETALRRLARANRVTPNRVSFIIKCGQHAEEFAQALIALLDIGRATKRQITKEQMTSLRSQIPQAGQIANGLNILSSNNMATTAYVNAVIKSGEYAAEIAEMLIFLRSHGLASRDNLEKVYFYRIHANSINNICNQLAKIKLLNPETFKALFSQVNYLGIFTADRAETVAKLLERLNNAGLPAAKYLELLMPHYAFADKLYTILAILPINEITSNKVDLLLKNAKQFTILPRGYELPKAQGLGVIPKGNVDEKEQAPLIGQNFFKPVIAIPAPAPAPAPAKTTPWWCCC